VISAIATVEVPAALWRKHRLGELTVDACALLVRAFEADVARGGAGTQLVAVALTAEVLESAAALTAVHPLRAYDAVQLASAHAARRADPVIDAFACFDADLSAAATTERFRPLH
jgi:predicted nucleic acid-binding protein